MEDDKDWSSRWSKKKAEYSPGFWFLVLIITLVLAGLAWLKFFPPAPP